MVKIYRFAGIRPVKSDAAHIASVPYDVVSTDEARSIIEKNPKSFLRVIRSDAELFDIPANDERIYARAHENLKLMIEKGFLVRDAEPDMYLYRVKQAGNIYLGLVACVGVDDYIANTIRRHENTRYDKEEDRTRHIDATNANTGLVVLLYRDSDEIFSHVESSLPREEPDAMVKTDHGVVHELFRISDDVSLRKLESLFDQVDALYIADGHHRAKSAVTVAERRRALGLNHQESGHFMAVIFAESRVKIHGYSRLVADLSPFTKEEFLARLSTIFDVKRYGEIDDTVFCIPPLHEFSAPHHVIHMYLTGKWYELSYPVENSDDIIGSLDVSLLQNMVLEGLLGITDPRSDPRLQYLGGARPLSDLEERVDSGEFAVAFSMQPVRIETVLAIADRGEVMPPKSTWFEPKLLSGLVIHELE